MGMTLLMVSEFDAFIVAKSRAKGKLPKKVKLYLGTSVKRN